MAPLLVTCHSRCDLGPRAPTVMDRESMSHPSRWTVAGIEKLDMHHDLFVKSNTPQYETSSVASVEHIACTRTSVYRGNVELYFYQSFLCLQWRLCFVIGSLTETVCECSAL